MKGLITVTALIALLVCGAAIAQSPPVDSVDAQGLTAGAIFIGGGFDEQADGFAARVGGMFLPTPGLAIIADADIHTRNALKFSIGKYWTAGKFSAGLLLGAGADFLDFADSAATLPLTYFTMCEGIWVAYQVHTNFGVWAAARYVNDVRTETLFQDYGQIGGGVIFYPPLK